MSLRKKYWLHVFVWVACIYSTLYFVRPICKFLKATTPFNALINIILATASLIILAALVKKVRISTKTIISAIIIISAYAIILAKIPIPEERIHFLEYGLLSFLIYRAISLDVQGFSAYLIACIITSLLGWGDEGIQYLLPNRYYQLKDVILNVLGGILGLFITYAFSQKKPKRGSKKNCGN